MKKAIVVGATSGIGKALAIQLANENYRVGITGRRAELLQELRNCYPESFVECCYDVNNMQNADELSDLSRKLGGLVLIIN